jgi:hypothetical protein
MMQEMQCFVVFESIVKASLPSWLVACWLGGWVVERQTLKVTGKLNEFETNE